MLRELNDLRLKNRAWSRWDTVGMWGMRKNENYNLSPQRLKFLNFSSCAFLSHSSATPLIFIGLMRLRYVELRL